MLWSALLRLARKSATKRNEHAHILRFHKKTVFAQLLIRKLRCFIRLWRVILLRSDIRLTTSGIRALTM